MSANATDRINGVLSTLAIKAPVRVATTANITLSGLQTVDGVSLAAGDRVLVKDQTTASENGIYCVASGAWTRAPDFNGNRDATQGTIVVSQQGTTNAKTAWDITTEGEITIGTTSLTFAQAVLLGSASSVQYQLTGSGTVVRSVASKFTEIVSVTDLGADNTGTELANTAINNTLARGGQIYIPAGTYLIDASALTTGITFSADNTFVVAHPDAIFQASNVTAGAQSYQILRFGKRKADEGSLSADRVYNISWSGGVFKGDRATNTNVTPAAASGHGIFITNVEVGVLRDVKVQDCWGDGIYFDKTGIGQTDESEPFDVLVDKATVSNSRRNSCSLILYKDITIVNSIFEGSNGQSPESGIDVEPDGVQTLRAKGLTIKNCTSRNNNGEGIAVIGTTLNVIDDVLIDGNKIYNNGLVTSARGGVFIRTPGDSTDGGKSGIRIVNNHIWDNFGDGIFVASSSNAPNDAYEVYIHNNDIFANKRGQRSGTDFGNGIFFDEYCSAFIVDGNRIRENDLHGLISDGSQCTQGVFANNLITGNGQYADVTYDGLYVGSNDSNILVHGNFIRVARAGLSYANEQRYGINIQTLDATILDNDIVNGGTTGNINVPGATMVPDDSGRTVLVRNNRGYKNETIFRTAPLPVNKTGTISISVAHGLDTQNLSNTAHQDKLISQVSLTMVDYIVSGSTAVSGNPVVVPRAVSIDATNIGIKYTVVTAGTNTDLVDTGTYRWTASGSGTNEYYLELAGGGNPSVAEPENVLENSTTIMGAGTVGSLTASQWDYGDNDSLGFSTIYVRIADGTDPDGKATGYLSTGDDMRINISVNAPML